MRHAVQNPTAPPAGTHEAGELVAAADYIASQAGDLAALAHSHGLDTLGYILNMARLEAETVARGHPPADSPEKRALSR